MKFSVIVADPPWQPDDKLNNTDDVKRGAASQYQTLSLEKLKTLPVSSISEKDSVLALWILGSMLSEGLDLMKAWGFNQKQIVVWNKIKKKDSLKDLIVQDQDQTISNVFSDNSLTFGMGRLFRQCHELCLIGTKGKVYGNLKNKSQRSVFFEENAKHSKKPEILQDRLDLMFTGNKLEIFARRDRLGWTCIGNECPTSLNEDIFDSIERLKGI